MATNNPGNAREVQQWMEDIAKQRQPTGRVIFDKRTKRLIRVPSNDPRADQAIAFTPQDLKKFIR